MCLQFLYKVPTSLRFTHTTYRIYLSPLHDILLRLTPHFFSYPPITRNLYIYRRIALLNSILHKDVTIRQDSLVMDVI